MNRGLIDLWDVFELEAVYTPTVDSGARADGALRTVYIDPTTGLAQLGIELNNYTENPGITYAVDTFAELTIPALGVAESRVYSGAIAVTSNLQVFDSRLDVMPGGYFTYSWSDIVWTVNGSPEYSVGAGSLDSAELGPAYWPLLGVCAWMAGNGTVHVIPPDPPVLTPSNSEVRGECTVTGGWRKKTGATWVSFPVELVTTPLPIPAGCGCVTAVEPPLSASDTSSFSTTGFARVFTEDVVTHEYCPCPPGCTETGHPTYSVHTMRAGFEISAASAVLIPDFTKSIERWQDKAGDFMAFIERSKMPQVLRVRQATCNTGTGSLVEDGTVTTFYEATPTHPRQSEIISVVSDAFHAIEDTLGYPTLAPYLRAYRGHIASGTTHTFDTGSGKCIPSVDCAGAVDCFTDTYSWCLLDTQEGISGAEAGNCLPLLDAGSLSEDYRGWATYANTWASPHWSFGYRIEDWNVLGSIGFWANYWGLIGSQWLYNPFLPVFEQRKTRNSIIESPLESSPLAFYQTFRFGWRWLGVSRFYADLVELPTSVATSSASSPAWSFTNASGVFAGSVTVTPTNTSVTIEIDIGRYGEVPYQYPHICNQVSVNWSGASITGVVVSLVSADGSSTEVLGTSTSTLHITGGTDTKYAGSWAMDEGAGYITDLGSDDGPHVADGESSTVMADAERVGSFNYLLGRQAAKLRFEFTLSSLAAFTVDYPTWRTVGGGYLYHSRESRQVTDVFYAAHAGIRFGNHRYTGAASPPTVQPEGVPPTAVDYLCWKRQWCLGVSETGGSPTLATELATIFDATEGNAVADADDDTNAFVLPRRATNAVPVNATFYGAVVNSLREVPPMAMAARKERDSAYEETGGYCLQTFCFAQEPRRFLTPGTLALKFEDPSGTPWTTVEAGWPSGWAVSSFVHQVDNDEGYGYVTKDGTLYGRMRGWRGAFAVINHSSASGADPFNHESTLGRYSRVHVESGVVYSGVDWSRPYPGFDRVVQVTSDPTDERPRILEDPLTGRIFVTFTR